MREIVTFTIGGAGNNIGHAFWKLIAYEHGINYETGRVETRCPLQMQRIDVYFNKTIEDRYYARNISIDTDPDIQFTENPFLQNPKNVVRGFKGAGNNFAAGLLTEGASILEKSLETIRTEVENLDYLQGFQIIHSIGGGTGSGFNSSLMNLLSQEYSDHLISNFVVIPSPQISHIVVEPYNALLSVPSLIEFSHLTFCIDNDSLFQICQKQLNVVGCTVQNINHIVALTMSGVTTCLRFPGQLNTSLRKIYVNMVPFPAMHFLVAGFAPLHLCKAMRYLHNIPAELVQCMFSSNNLLCNVDLTCGKILTAASIFRGKLSPTVLEELLGSVRQRNSENFVEWIPNSIKSAFCDVPPRGLTHSGTFIANTTSITYVWKKVREQALTMLQSKAHLHWYYGEGMEEQEFYDALECLNGLISDYDTKATDDL